MSRVFLFLSLALIVAPCFASAQVPARPEILVLGTYHMANPGHDIHSSQTDDVTSPARQREIVRLIDVLTQFQPTKIAIEANIGSLRAQREYGDYVAGKYALTANEIDQIGFRLAKKLGCPSIYPVDENGDFPFYRVRNYAIANGKKEQFEASQNAVGARVRTDDAFLANHTVLEMLMHVNSDSSVAMAVGEYYTGFMPFGEPFEYAGPDLIASWFQRNLRIYHNIRALITSPSDRILVIYGSGHLGWLRQIVSQDPAVRLRTLNELVAEKSYRSSRKLLVLNRART